MIKIHFRFAQQLKLIIFHLHLRALTISTSTFFRTMKQILTLILFSAVWSASFGQESMEKVMEKRARDMHRVIGLTDKAQYRKFIQENYTEALINKPMRAAVKEGDQGETNTSEVKSTNNLEAKVKMFERLHGDFGGARIVSIKSNAEILKMVLDNGEGMTGTFQLKFDKTKPYLIDGIGIEAGN